MRSMISNRNQKDDWILKQIFLLSPRLEDAGVK